MPEMLQDRRRKFLEHFDPAKRSTVANVFLEPIRKGINDPEAVMTTVYEQTKKKEDKRYITEAIYNFLNDARAYIEYLQDWEQLPDSEKQYYKNIQAKKAVKAYMAKELPTEKQLAYLKFLGYTGPAPESKADASELISTIKLFKKL